MNKFKVVNVFRLVILACLCIFVTSCSGGSSSNGDDGQGDCPPDQERCQSRQEKGIGM
jgi:hypothetical protein